MHKKDAPLRAVAVGNPCCIPHSCSFRQPDDLRNPDFLAFHHHYPVSIGSLFIVDPLYTVPLLIGGLVYLIRRNSFCYNANRAGLLLSSLYIVWSLGVQVHVRSHAVASLEKQNLPAVNVLVTPSPLNTLLWRVASIDKDGYHVGYYSIFDKSSEMSFRKVDSSYHLLDQLSESTEVQSLTVLHGFFSVDSIDGHWVVSDIRMGVEPDYVFQFAVAKDDNGSAVHITHFRHVGSARRSWAHSQAF